MGKNRRKIKKSALIDAQMSVNGLISKYPETTEVFLKYGFHCFGCLGASFETLKQAAKVHGVKLADLSKDLNRAVEKRKIKSRK